MRFCHARSPLRQSIKRVTGSSGPKLCAQPIALDGFQSQHSEMHRSCCGTRYKVLKLFSPNLSKEITHFSSRTNLRLNGPPKLFSEYAFTVEFVNALPSALHSGKA